MFLKDDALTVTMLSCGRKTTCPRISFDLAWVTPLSTLAMTLDLKKGIRGKGAVIIQIWSTYGGKNQKFWYNVNANTVNSLVFVT